ERPTASCGRSAPSARTWSARCNTKPTRRNSGARATTARTTWATTSSPGRRRGPSSDSASTGGGGWATRKSSPPAASKGHERGDSTDRRLAGRADRLERDPPFRRREGRADPRAQGVVLPRRHDALSLRRPGVHRHPAAALLPPQLRRSLRERAVHRHAGAVRVADSQSAQLVGESAHSARVRAFLQRLLPEIVPEPRELTWLTGILLLFLMLGFG